jgi:hypothetical protein
MSQDNKAHLAEKVLSAATPVEATAVVQEVKATVASEATVLAMRRRNAITMLKERVQAILALSITASAIVASFVLPEIDQSMQNALMVVLGYFLRDSEKPEKPQSRQQTRSTDV